MLTYHLVPATSAPATHHALILHGLGDSMHGWLPVTGMLGIPRLGYALANAPRPYHDGFSWFDLAGDFSVDPAQIRASRAALAELIEHLLKTLAIPSERLFLIGFSQGALIAMDTVLRSQRRFAGVVAISGFLRLIEEYPDAFGSALASQRILITHGRRDPLIPIQAVRAQKDQLLGLGVALRWKDYDKVHTLDATRELADIVAFLREGMAASEPGRPGSAAR
jgi:phospholipase/carboxylesterase